jgi:hypothetical protein
MFRALFQAREKRIEGSMGFRREPRRRRPSDHLDFRHEAPIEGGEVLDVGRLDDLVRLGLDAPPIYATCGAL